MVNKKEENKARSIGIIMDGNRRWAKAKGLPTMEGHRLGYLKLKEVVQWAKDAGVTHCLVYAFSTENWKRTKEEVGYLMNLFRMLLKKELAEFQKENCKLVCVGELSKLPADLQKDIKKAEEATSANKGLTLCICISYGGRQEIVQAVRKAVEEKREIKSEEDFSSLISTSLVGIPDPDLIIRSGGEMRLSGFLTWQSIYSELFFTETLWPDFSKEEFFAILEEFSKRKRNLGK